MFNREKHKTPGKTHPNETSLALAKTMADLAMWAFTSHIQAYITMKSSEPFIGSITCNTMILKPWVHNTMCPKTIIV